MKNKSNKSAKLERDRYSLFTDDMSCCYLCQQMGITNTYHITKHELFCGRNRANSMAYGLVLPLCEEHHHIMQNDAYMQNKWHILGQKEFEKNYNINFIDIFKKNYK
jgi:hypothetical protein